VKRKLITIARLALIAAIAYGCLEADAAGVKPGNARALVPIDAAYPWLMADAWRVAEYKLTGRLPNRLYKPRRAPGVNYNDPNLR